MSKTEQQTKRKIMEKLRIYGIKEEGEPVFIAAVYFDASGKLIVDSEYPKVKKYLTKDIERLNFAVGWGDSEILNHIINKVSILDFTITERKITGKRLEFYGRKWSDPKHIATVYVDKDKKVVVETEDPKIKEDLLNAIFAEGNVDKDGRPVFRIKSGPPTEELKRKEEEERKRGKFSYWVSYVRPGDPDFLTGLYYGVKETIREGGWSKLGDYYVWDHDIVEE